MRVAMMSREFPPDVYGGAGVHVDFLARELRRLVDLDVHCWGTDRDGAVGHSADAGLEGANAALRTLSIDLRMAAAVAGADVVHSHTWYANLGGHLANLLHGAPHVVTAHSLEPLRPWKAEQLGGGYAVSSWAERTAYEAADAVIAVSQGMRADILTAYPTIEAGRVHVVHNGIDTTLYCPVEATDVVERVGIDPARPYVVFVGRITHQKGVGHLVAAAHDLDPGVQVLLCAGAPDTAEIGAATTQAVQRLQAKRDGVVWVEEMLPREELVQLLTHAAVFCCPSVYEPLGIVNLEAMACGTAVVASDVGGIPEVVDDGVTGRLVAYDAADSERFEADLAARVNEVVRDPDAARRMGAAGRERAIAEFGWDAIARRTVEIYQSLLR
ncbi:MAG TPA: glycogen synthase [Nocardioidaceae bacterium]|nr:glycogen synthase [Nocardioidaceae bacterium]